jgi:hypothetical protein
LIKNKINQSINQSTKQVATFMRPLPASLRINFDCPYGDRLKEELMQYCNPSEDNQTGAVKTLDWFPEGRGFQLEVDRNTIRKVIYICVFKKKEEKYNSNI